MKLLLALFLFISTSYADRIEGHRKEYKEMVESLDKYEKRLAELKNLKKDTGDGSTLDGIISEIADIQKKFLDLKQRKNKLTAHLHREHPGDDLITEMSLARKNEPKDGTKEATLKLPGKDDNLEQRLNRLSAQIQSQYSRTAKDRQELEKKTAGNEPIVIDVDAAKKKKREILQEDKDKYLKETLKTKMQLNKPEPAATEEAHDEPPAGH